MRWQRRALRWTCLRHWAARSAGAWLVAREVAPQHDAPAAEGGWGALSATAMVGPTFEAEA